jgi:hypothetical protein
LLKNFFHPSFLPATKKNYWGVGVVVVASFNLLKKIRGVGFEGFTLTTSFISIN